MCSGGSGSGQNGTWWPTTSTFVQSGRRGVWSQDRQYYVELGFILVKIDGMGTNNRSKSFHDVAFKNLGDAGFPDRILWHQAVKQQYSCVGCLEHVSR